MSEFESARHNMVESQLRPNRVSTPAVIEAFQQVPREQFVPPARRPVAYVDEDLYVGRGRYLMEPRILARMIETAEISPNDLVLEIGCCTGYSTAILARLGSTIVAVENDEEFVRGVEERLSASGVDNAIVMSGDLAAGHADQAPYDVIIFGGAVDRIPDTVTEQLAEGGRLVAVVRPASEVGVAMLFTKHGGHVSGRPVFDAATPYLPGFEPKPAFAL